MAMGKRTSEQAPLWVPTTDLPVSPGHPFYTRLNRILDDAGFDRFAEEQCQRFYGRAVSHGFVSNLLNDRLGPCARLTCKPRLRWRG